MAMLGGFGIEIRRATARLVAFASAIAGLLTVLVSPAHAQTAIDFENLETPVKVFGQYSGLGVSFNGPRAMKHSPRITGVGRVALELCFEAEFCDTPLIMKVADGHNGISLVVGSSIRREQRTTVVMRAFDVAGEIVGVATVEIGPSTREILVNQPLKIEKTARNIRRVTVGYAPGPDGPRVNNGLVVDDVQLVARQMAALQFHAMETVQATQTFDNKVPLVAGKPTIVRAFVSLNGTTGQTVTVTGKLTARRPNGETMGPVTYTGVLEAFPWFEARLREHGALNFRIPDEWTQAGSIRFSLSEVSIDGGATLPCVNCVEYAHFRPTRQLNLVLAPHINTALSPPQTPELILTPSGSLQWLNNVYPLRGAFPGDASGIRILAYLPLGAADAFGDSQLDELETRWTLLRASNVFWPDFYLMGTRAGAVGGIARLNTRVSLSGTRSQSLDPLAASEFEIYGPLWSHELAHNFGRSHAGNAHGEANGNGFDADFPHPHGGIGDPGVATITNWWDPERRFMELSNSGRHEHDLMSYGSLSSSHTGNWISPYTYKSLFSELAMPNAASVPPASPSREVLVVIGHLKESGIVSLRPFWRMSTSMVSSQGVSGAFKIELLDGMGELLGAHYFDADRASEGTGLHFSEYVPWIEGTQEIRLSGPDGELSRAKVSARAPKVRVAAPRYDGRLSKLHVSWEAEDTDSDLLWFSVLYRASDDQPWLPIANQVTGRSVEVDTRLLPGSRTARLRIIATDGANSVEAYGARAFAIDDKPPMVGILSPMQGNERPQQGTVEFIGAAYDPEDGILADRQLQWTSDRDGVLGIGSRLKIDKLSPGRHNVTLSARDGAGQNAVAATTISVAAVTSNSTNP